jgi:molybdenum cofactor cytidylyltransferase
MKKPITPISPFPNRKPETNMICALILAAGRGQRMGTHKLLLPFGNSTVIASVFDAFFESAAVDAIWVVVRAGEAGIRTALVGRPVHLVENPDPQADMLSSVRCGVRALPPEAETILVSPGDQPSLSAQTVRELVALFRHKRATILVPVYQGQRGHPLVLTARFRQEILTSYDGVGLRGLLQAHASEVLEWSASDPAVLQDIDTPEDYHRALAGEW